MKGGEFLAIIGFAMWIFAIGVWAGRVVERDFHPCPIAATSQPQRVILEVVKREATKP